MKTIIYAASDATFIEIDSARFWKPPATFVQSGKVYRRLTPEYWAWFRRKFLILEKALVNGKVSEETFVEILDRMSKLYNHAVAAYGKEALREAVKADGAKEIDDDAKQGNDTDGARQTSARSSRGRVPSIVVERGC